MDKEMVLKDIWNDERLEVFFDFMHNSPVFLEQRRVISEEDYVVGIWCAFTHGYGVALEDTAKSKLATNQSELFAKARDYLNAYLEVMQGN